MTRTEEAIKEEYHKHLDPIEFRDFKVKAMIGTDGRTDLDFYFKCLYDFFSRGDFPEDSSLLDLGSGATVHNVASASAFISSIVLSDLVEANRDHLRRWLRKEPGCLDWTPFMKRVALAEGRSDSDATCSEIEARIRRAVKSVVHCDVLDDQVVPPEAMQKPYDVLLSAYTFETAAVSKESFSAILGRIRNLLKPRGKLVLIGAIKTSYWTVGNNRFHYLSNRDEDIQEALEENGFGDIQWQLRDWYDEKSGNKSSTLAGTDCASYYFLSCSKI